MAYEIPNFSVGVVPSDVDLSGVNASNVPIYQYAGVCVYTAVSVQGTGVGGAAINLPSATSSPIIGVLQNNPQQGEAAQVVVQGITKAQAAASFNIGQLLMVNSAGAFLPATSGNYAVAQALESAASGDITTVLLIRNGKQ